MLHILAPHLTLAIGSLVLLMYGAFTADTKGTAFLAGITLLLAAFFGLFMPASGALFAVDANQFLLHVSPYTSFAGLIMVLLALASLPLLCSCFKAADNKPELPVLLLLSLTGMLVLASSYSLITLYVALELMSFPLYIMAAFLRDDAKSSEAGLKYFVLGSLASGLMLYGMSMLYAATGTLHFGSLAMALNPATMPVVPPLVLIGVVLTVLGTVFKLSMVPFHMWTPDVYEGAPTPVTAVMSALPKLAAFVLLVRLLNGPFASLAEVWQPALAILATLSMLGGSIMAVVQTNLKRLLAWSTIANVGFITTGVVAATPLGASGVLFYLSIYGLTSLALFGIVIISGATTVEDLKGLARTRPTLAALFLVLLFSLAGVPPFAGFMAKFAVFSATVAAGWYLLAVLGVIASVIASFYSLWLIKVMYFDAPLENAAPLPGQPLTPAIAALLAITGILTVLLGILPGLLSNLTLAAATALY